MTVNKHLILPALAALLLSAGCASKSTPAEPEAPSMTPAPEQTSAPAEETDMIYAYVNDSVLNIRPADNSSAEAFTKLLKEDDITVEMHDYGSFEKVGDLPSSLPQNNEEITTSPGDLILYQGNRITIYYDTNSWSLTRLGKVQGLSQKELKEILGSGSITVTFSLNAVQKDHMKTGTQTVMLNSGYEMPVIGLGTWTLSDEEAENSVYHALKAGMRLIDTARYYGNETGVGKGLQKAMDEGIVTREEVFITSKVMPSDYNRAAQGIQNSLRDLNVSYIDLMLIHQPGSNDEAVYRALENAVRAGTVRSVGISNYYTKEAVDEVLSYAEIMPAVIQNENHLYYQNTELQDYVRQYGIVIESWYPFGGRGHTADHFGNETIGQLAAKYGKTPAQIILRWHIQAGYIAIPGSSDPDHIAENYDIFGFSLTEEEMQDIYALDTHERYENW